MLNLMNEGEAAPTDDEPEPSPGTAGGTSVDLPSPQAVVNELEEFLRQLRREDAGDANGE
jgi:hypothetical protein